MELRAGDVALWASSRPARFAVVEPLCKRTILLPRTRVVGSGPDRRGWTATALPRGTLTADLLRAQLGVLARQCPAEGRQAEEVAARVVADVVSGCVSAFAAAAGGVGGVGDEAARDAPHFSRAYRQQFGERPRDTVERAHAERDSSC